MKCPFLRIILPLLIFFAPVFAHASETEEALVVELTAGTKEYFFLNDKPVIYFEGDSLHITTDDFSAALADVVKFTFELADREAVAVKSVIGSKQMTIAYNDGKTLQINGVSAADIKVYSVDGRATNAEISSQDNGVTINLSNLHSGVYIIKASSQSFKIYKK